LVEGVEALSGAALERAKEITHSGKLIDEHQVLAERVAYAATEARAARELFEHASGRDRIDPLHVKTCVAAVADLAHSLSTRLGSTLDELGLGETAVERIFPAKLRALMRQAAAESVFRKIGRAVAEDGGRSSLALDEIHEQVRQSVRSFADSEVAPHAERIHRHDELVPEELISKMSELGYFGLVESQIDPQGQRRVSPPFRRVSVAPGCPGGGAVATAAGRALQTSNHSARSGSRSRQLTSAYRRSRYPNAQPTVMVPMVTVSDRALTWVASSISVRCTAAS
jgi:hypothetical protein